MVASKNNVLSLDEFQNFYLNKKQVLNKNIDIGLLFDSNNKKHLIKSSDIHFIFNEPNYNKVNFQLKYLVGYQYFDGNFYTIINIDNINNDDITNTTLNNNFKTVIYLNKYKIGILVNNIQLININRLIECDNNDTNKFTIPGYISKILKNKEGNKFYLIDVDKLNKKL